MNTIKKVVQLALISVFLINQAWSQKRIEIINSQEILKEGIDLFEKGKYQEAIDLYLKVPPGDTNYFAAQYEACLSYYNLENYQKVVDLSRLLIAEGTDQISQYNLLGSALDELNRKKESIKVYEDVQKKYPFNVSMLLNKGIVYESDSNYEKAFETYRELLEISPLYPSAHLRLAQMAEKEGRLTQAIMAYTFFLILEPSSKRSTRTLVQFNKLCNNSSSLIGISEKKVLDNEFEDIDFLISNQVALNNKYKIPGKMTFPINRQLYLVLEKVAELKDNQNGFFARTYLPFFKNFLKTQSFENLSLLMMASSDVDNISKVVNKNIPELKKSRNTYVDLISNIKPTKSYELNGKKLNLKYWFDNDFNLDALGNVNAANKRVGDWIFFNSSGSVSMTGSYDENGNREGNFTSFDIDGDSINTFSYKNGKADGPYTLFNDGKVKEKGTYVNDLLEGIVTFYYKNGSLKAKDTFKNDKRNGAGVEYFYNGKVKFEYTYLNNELEGNFKEYNIYGGLVMECNYLKGKYNGVYKEYYNNGKLKKDLNYVNGILEGTYKTFHFNGNIEQDGKAVKGSISGKWMQYYSNGKVKSISNMDENGKINGEETLYNFSGKKYAQETYQKGDWKGTRYFDKDGKLVSDVKVNKAGFNFIIYNSRFDKAAEGKLIEGKRDGEWRFYNSLGSISGTEMYQKGELNGESKNYYLNGKLSSTFNYKDDKLEGLKLSYFLNGNIEEEGNYLDDLKCGVWRGYSENGSISNEYFYSGGRLNGYGYEYLSNGKIEKKYKYEDGLLQNIYHCDTNGIVIDSVKLDNGKVTLKGLSGSKGFEGLFIDGEKNGPISWYYPNGNVWIKCNYLADDRNGDFIEYNPIGKIIQKRSYLYGVSNGVSEYYNYFGILRQKLDNVNGEIHGKNIFYYENGKPEIEIDYYEGEKNGASKYYSETGELRQILFFEMGRCIGYSYLNQAGKLVDTIFAKNGVLKVKAYYQNGNISTEYEIKNDDYDGTYKIYHPNGKLQEERFYECGLETKPNKKYFSNGNVLRIENMLLNNYHGESIEYNINGTLRMKENYVNSYLNGLCEYYDTNGKLLNAYYYVDGELFKIIK